VSHRRLHIAAYDVRHPKRLRRALHVLKDFSCGGQFSVFECYLDEHEKAELIQRISGTIDLRIDRFLIVPLPGHRNVQVLGAAVKPADPTYFYVG